MKKLIPILTIIGLSTFIVTGCESNLTQVKDNYISNINEFKKDVDNYSNITNTSAKTILSKYKLDVEPNIELLNENLQPIQEFDENAQEQAENIEDGNKINDNIREMTDNIEQTIEENEFNVNVDKNIENNLTNISTLYSLSNDIDESCDAFCQLKTSITDAIVETQNLIKKVQNSEITLTTEQKMFITEQSRQLKALGKQLSGVTTELAINLSDLSKMFQTENGELDTLSMKYLVVLDNLVNGNEMLESSLQSLNMINSLFRANGDLPPNNTGRILYGFRRNNEPPIIKDYSIENGEIIDNSNKTSENNEKKDETTVVDTYKDTKLKSNIDTYGNTNSNIDSFFNTAWLDNEFMYGNNYNGYTPGYANNGVMNGYYPYVNNNKENTTNSVNNNTNTQQNENSKTNKDKKKFKLQKNIDTYRDENTPTVSAKLTVIKNSINDFINKFKGDDSIDEIKDKIKN